MLIEALQKKRFCSDGTGIKVIQNGKEFGHIGTATSGRYPRGSGQHPRGTSTSKKVRAYPYMNYETQRLVDRNRREDYKNWNKEAMDRAESFVKTAVENAEIRIRIPDGIMQNVIDDGRLKSQFETRFSNGLFNNDMRASAEYSMFATGHDARGDARPIYGYLAAKGSDVIQEEGMVHQYGDTVLTLNDDCRDRTTFYVGDSLTGAFSTYIDSMPQPMSAPSARALDHGCMMEVTTRPPMDELDPTKVPCKGMTCYWEAQVHGGVHVSDIKEIGVTGEERQKSVAWSLQDAGYPGVVCGPSKEERDAAIKEGKIPVYAHHDPGV